MSANEITSLYDKSLTRTFAPSGLREPMAEFQKRDSGLVVPVEKPKEPTRKYGVLEIREDTRRQQAKEAMGLLWRAMKLDCSSHVKLPDDYP